MTDTLIENVSDTAFWVAHYRGVETARSDALFQDPLAARLAGDRGKQIAQAMPLPFFTAWTIAIRTSLIDDYIRRAVREGIDTVLNLGAGLDTRPYRMDLPGDLAWIEVDYPEVVAFKEQKLAQERPRCQLTRIKLDLANVAERRRLLADIDARAKKTLILTEGVIPYLSEEEAASLADDLSALDHVSYWIVDYFSREVLKSRQRRIGHRMRNAPFKFDPDDWHAFFGAHGWHCKEMRYLAIEAARLGRRFPLPPLMKLIWGIRRLFMSQARRADYRKFAGYALLEPNSRPERSRERPARDNDFRACDQGPVLANGAVARSLIPNTVYLSGATARHATNQWFVDIAAGNCGLTSRVCNANPVQRHRMIGKRHGPQEDPHDRR